MICATSYWLLDLDKITEFTMSLFSNSTMRTMVLSAPQGCCETAWFPLRSPHVSVGIALSLALSITHLFHWPRF